VLQEYLQCACVCLPLFALSFHQVPYLLESMKNRKTAYTQVALLATLFATYIYVFHDGSQAEYPLRHRKLRTAYVVSTNTSAPRFQQATEVLENFGFAVKVVEPDNLGSTREQQTLSNKNAFVSAVRLISQGDEPWGYLFEDDIVMHEKSAENLDTLVAAESHTTLFQYLGICPVDPHAVSRKMCGRCAHAMGLSREGAMELLGIVNCSDFNLGRDNSTREEIYFDVIVDGWCQEHDGFLVFGPLYESKYGVTGAGHVGTFLQDRSKFESEIDQA
jgi:hypothetical protein